MSFLAKLRVPHCRSWRQQKKLLSSLLIADRWIACFIMLCSRFIGFKAWGETRWSYCFGRSEQSLEVRAVSAATQTSVLLWNQYEIQQTALVTQFIYWPRESDEGPPPLKGGIILFRCLVCVTDSWKIPNIQLALIENRAQSRNHTTFGFLIWQTIHHHLAIFCSVH